MTSNAKNPETKHSKKIYIKNTKIEIFYPDSVIMVRLTKPSNFKFPA